MALLEFLATATGAWVITTDVAQGITRGFDGVMMSVIVIVTAVGTMHVSPDLPVVVIVIAVRSMDVFGFGFFFLHAG